MAYGNNINIVINPSSINEISYLCSAGNVSGTSTKSNNNFTFFIRNIDQTITISADGYEDYIINYKYGVYDYNITMTVLAINVSQLEKNGTIYTIKDSVARNSIANLAIVATSGNYNDLINKPTIPSVNDATLTIQKNGSNITTFSANASSNVTANISVPNTVSSVSSSSTNADAVGAKLFYDTVGDIESTINTIRGV